MAKGKGTAVIAIGGNSLIKDTQHQTVRDQYIAAKETCMHIVSMVADGWNVVITHGNGPQVGFILRRSELAASELHELPLDTCGADTQGALGYALQQNLYNEFRRLGMDKEAVSLVTQVEVDINDPAFKAPSKPIGSFMDEAKAKQRSEKDAWSVAEDAGRGWRRVVASPKPLRIVEEASIRRLVDAGVVVIAVGGGGIPVVKNDEGELEGTSAVIDKDFASSLLARRIKADLFIICTAVEKVALNFGKPNQVWLDRMSLREAKEHLAEGSHFAKGSMGPKIQAAVDYLEGGGTEALITNPENLEKALAGQTGTRITN
ncbi:carbamate kinase [Treponema sp.]